MVTFLFSFSMKVKLIPDFYNWAIVLIKQYFSSWGREGGKEGRRQTSPLMHTDYCAMYLPTCIGSARAPSSNSLHIWNISNSSMISIILHLVLKHHQWSSQLANSIISYRSKDIPYVSQNLINGNRKTKPLFSFGTKTSIYRTSNSSKCPLNSN